MPVARWHWLVAGPVALAAHAAVGLALLRPPFEAGGGAGSIVSIALTLAADTALADATPAAPKARNPSRPPILPSAAPVLRAAEPPAVTARAADAPLPEPSAIGPSAIGAEQPPLQTARSIKQPSPVPTPPTPPQRREFRPIISSPGMASPIKAPPDISERPAATAATAAAPPLKTGTASSGSRPAATAAPSGPAAAARAGYVTALQAWLEQHKRYPDRARARRQQGTATLSFVVNRQGAVLAYHLEQSSGHHLLDREALALIERAAPLPQMPAGLAATDLTVVIPIRFALR